MTNHSIASTTNNSSAVDSKSSGDHCDKKRKTLSSSSSSSSSASSSTMTLEEAVRIITKLEKENEELALKLEELSSSKNPDIDVDALTESERNGSGDGGGDDDPFRAFLSNDSNEPWAVKYRQLHAYKSKHGDCRVPKTFGGGLGSWVDNQRTAYRNFRAGKKSAMTQRRIDALDEMEFYWGPKFPAPYRWEDGLAELEKYSTVMGHANIPIDDSNQTPVAKWIRRVRREWTLLLKGKESTSLDVEKIHTLKDVGFNRRV